MSTEPTRLIYTSAMDEKGRIDENSVTIKVDDQNLVPVVRDVLKSNHISAREEGAGRDTRGLATHFTVSKQDLPVFCEKLAAKLGKDIEIRNEYDYWGEPIARSQTAADKNRSPLEKAVLAADKKADHILTAEELQDFLNTNPIARKAGQILAVHGATNDSLVIGDTTVKLSDLHLKLDGDSIPQDVPKTFKKQSDGAAR